MKKQPKKLTLDRETLVPLQPEQLETVVGGAIFSNSCCWKNSCNTKVAA